MWSSNTQAAENQTVLICSEPYACSEPPHLQAASVKPAHKGPPCPQPAGVHAACHWLFPLSPEQSPSCMFLGRCLPNVGYSSVYELTLLLLAVLLSSPEMTPLQTGAAGFPRHLLAYASVSSCPHYTHRLTPRQVPTALRCLPPWSRVS